MKEVKRLGDAELEIMLAIWNSKNKVTSSYVLEHLQGKRKWALSTVMTSLSRLCEKGFLTCDRTTGSNLYWPLISEEVYKTKESQSFLEKMYGNSFQKFVTNLYENKVIASTDLEELRRFLDELEKRES